MSFRRVIVHAFAVSLQKDIGRSGNQGIGKPEPLRYQLAGYWSRRITSEHHLVYRIDDDGTILIAVCRYHYDGEASLPSPGIYQLSIGHRREDS